MDMYPSLLAFDLSNSSVLGQSERLGDFSMGAGSGENGKRLCGSEFGRVNPLPFGLPPLGLPIGRVIGVSAESEVIRVDARRRVAAMKDLEISAYRAVPQLVRNAVRKGLFAINVESRIPSWSRRHPAEIASRQRFGDCVAVQPLLDRGVTLRVESTRRGISHLLAPRKQRVVRVGPRASTRVRPALYHEPTVLDRWAALGARLKG